MRETRSRVFEQDGRRRCLVPLYDDSDRVVGTVEWWDRERQVRLGETLVPRRIDVAVVPGQLQPTFNIAIELIKGVPQCRSFSVTAARGGPEVAARDLKSARLEDWIEAAVATAARDFIRLERGSLRRLTQESGTRERAKKAIKLGRSIRKLTPGFLARVAEIYRDNVHDKPVRAVELAFGVSNSTAGKYIVRARKAGLLPPTSKGKKSA